MDPKDFLIGVIRPTLKYIAEKHPDIRYDESVENLLLGTAVHESGGLKHLFQNDGDDDEYDGGLGVYQIESSTNRSIWENYLAYRPELASTIRSLASQGAFASKESLDGELITNLAFATAIARLVYLPKPGKIPDSLQGQADYYKKNYNTAAGKATSKEYVANWIKYI